MIENPLELGSGFGGLTCGEVGQSANIDGIQAAETADEADTPKSEIVARGGLQGLNRRWRISSARAGVRSGSSAMPFSVSAIANSC